MAKLSLLPILILISLCLYSSSLLSKAAERELFNPTLKIKNYLNSGYIGCFFDDICQENEICLNDIIFGQCGSPYLEKNSKFKFDSIQNEEAVSYVQLLLSTGFKWRNLYTQCVLKTLFFNFKYPDSQLDPLKFCGSVQDNDNLNRTNFEKHFTNIDPLLENNYGNEENLESEPDSYDSNKLDFRQQNKLLASEELFDGDSENIVETKVREPERKIDFEELEDLLSAKEARLHLADADWPTSSTADANLAIKSFENPHEPITGPISDEDKKNKLNYAKSILNYLLMKARKESLANDITDQTEQVLYYPRIDHDSDDHFISTTDEDVSIDGDSEKDSPLFNLYNEKQGNKFKMYTNEFIRPQTDESSDNDSDIVDELPAMLEKRAIVRKLKRKNPYELLQSNLGDEEYQLSNLGARDIFPFEEERNRRSMPSYQDSQLIMDEQTRNDEQRRLRFLNELRSRLYSIPTRWRRNYNNGEINVMSNLPKRDDRQAATSDRQFVWKIGPQATDVQHVRPGTSFWQNWSKDRKLTEKKLPIKGTSGSSDKSGSTSQLKAQKPSTPTSFKKAPKAVPYRGLRWNPRRYASTLALFIGVVVALCILLITYIVHKVRGGDKRDLPGKYASMRGNFSRLESVEEEKNEKNDEAVKSGGFLKSLTNGGKKFLKKLTGDKPKPDDSDTSKSKLANGVTPKSEGFLNKGALKDRTARMSSAEIPKRSTQQPRPSTVALTGTMRNSDPFGCDNGKDKKKQKTDDEKMVQPDLSNTESGCGDSLNSQNGSTSSCNSEPLGVNMDITTGHLILSYLEEHLKNRARLDTDWSSISSYETEDATPCLAAMQPGNLEKNRAGVPPPYEESRVRLEGQKSDYINASLIYDHDPKNPAYICAMSPLPNTVADFWRMVWEQTCSLLVVLDNPSSFVKQTGGNTASGWVASQVNTDVCAQYWPEEGVSVYGNFEVHLVSEHICCEHYVVRSLYLKNLANGETRTVTQFHYFTWPEKLNTETSRAASKSILEFRRKVNRSFRGKKNPILVHCRDACGRSGTYLLLDLVLNRITKGVKEVDIAASLEHLRDQRAGMVKTKDEFEFVLIAVAEEVNAILNN